MVNVTLTDFDVKYFLHRLVNLPASRHLGGIAQTKPAMTDASNPHVFDATAATFEDTVIRASLETPVLVDFWAEWCGPCKMIAPVLDELATQHKGKLLIVKINVDEHGDLAKQYGVRGIPTLMLFKGGLVEATKVGALSKSQLASWIDPLI